VGYLFPYIPQGVGMPLSVPQGVGMPLSVPQGGYTPRCAHQGGYTLRCAHQGGFLPFMLLRWEVPPVHAPKVGVPPP